ncbi:MAG: hypothetical protein ABJN42_24890 [Roseibium sp.]|uniref:hypothetical protein n=1 Tax=Roseibium sp. TaxID=1936156 RepID=UPI00329756E2
MTLNDFIKEEKRRIALFSAYWQKNMSSGETVDGDLVWPDDMQPGDWDEQLQTFDPEDATLMGLVAVEIDGDWSVEEANFEQSPSP